jgi:hypothetical protein
MDKYLLLFMATAPTSHIELYAVTVKGAVNAVLTY